jgi:hypothetical protein
MEVIMHDRYIKDMVRRLSPILKDKSEAERILKNCWRTKMALVWTVDDVYRAANEREVALTRKEAIHLLQELHQHHNPQSGIKWEDITNIIQDRVLGRKLNQREVLKFVHRDELTIQR